MSRIILPSSKAHLILPTAFLLWVEEEWVDERLEEAGVDSNSVLGLDVNARITTLGSRLLHLATLCPHRPSEAVTKEVIRFLLEDCSADPNVADDYGRTPLSLFITAGSASWRSDDEFGCAILELLFAHGARADVQFTPDYVHIAGRKKWSISDHLNDPVHGHSPLPLRMSAVFRNQLSK